MRRLPFLTLTFLLAGCFSELDAPPPGARNSALLYPVNEVFLTRGEPMAALVPVGPIASGAYVTVMPELPTGIVLDETSGLLSGTPTVEWPETTYTLRASSSHGIAETSLVLSVRDVAPSNLVYATNPATYTLGVAIAPNAPHTFGGNPTAFTIDPPLPPGLYLNRATGVLRGTPQQPLPLQSYIVIARGSGGEVQTTLSLVVAEPAPRELTYEMGNASYVAGTPIVPNPPQCKGGTPARYVVDPPLPEGLAVDPETGVISGAPRLPVDARTYRVTATNDGGEAVAELRIVVTAAPGKISQASAGAPLPRMTYEKPAIVAIRNERLRIAAPRGALKGTRFRFVPTLPTGLVLDPNSGVVTGVPTAASVRQRFTLLATQGTRFASATLFLEVREPAPAQLSYAQSPVRFRVGETVRPMAPATSGGTPTRYSIQPMLPPGLRLDEDTGVVDGMPTAAAALHRYAVVAWNTAGSTTGILSLAVDGSNRPPTALPEVVHTYRDVTVAIRLTATDPDGDALTFSIPAPPSHGTLVGTAPALTYVPASGWVGSDSFTFAANDGKETSPPATIHLTVGNEPSRGPASKK